MSEEVRAQPGSADVSTNDLLKAILAVLLDEREAKAAERPGQSRPEILLAGVGMGHQVIAQLLGKNPDAVRMMLARAKKAPNTGRSLASRKKPASDA
jgi:hypothetical protein